MTDKATNGLSKLQAGLYSTDYAASTAVYVTWHKTFSRRKSVFDYNVFH